MTRRQAVTPRPTYTHSKCMRLTPTEISVLAGAGHAHMVYLLLFYSLTLAMYVSPYSLDITNSFSTVCFFVRSLLSLTWASLCHPIKHHYYRSLGVPSLSCC